MSNLINKQTDAEPLCDCCNAEVTDGIHFVRDPDYITGPHLGITLEEARKKYGIYKLCLGCIAMLEQKMKPTYKQMSQVASRLGNLPNGQHLSEYEPS